MKKLVPVFLLMICFAFKAQARIDTVRVSNIVFTPNTLNVRVGDTVRWVWVSGTHTTTDNPTTNPGGGNVLPAGAAPWNSPIDAANPTFTYKVTVAGTYNYSCIPHQDLGMVGSFVATAAMPVVLSEFKLNAASNKPGLSWKTLTEENTDYFSIRRSYNGATYTEIARVPAAGNSSAERFYSYNDNTVSSKDKYAYYLIAIVDKDGQTQFTETRLFKNSLAAVKLVSSISPNPISSLGDLMLTFNSDRSGKMDLKVLNMEGRTLMQTRLNAVEGINKEHVQLVNLAPGTYNLVFRLNDVKETHRIIVK